MSCFTPCLTTHLSRCSTTLRPLLPCSILRTGQIPVHRKQDSCLAVVPNRTHLYTEHLTGRAHTRIFLVRTYTTAHHPHISSVGAPHWLKVKRVRVIFLSVSHPSRSLMSLLNVPFVRFPSVLSLPTASSSKRLPHPWQGVVAKAQARPLAGVSLAEWLTQTRHRLRSQARQLLQLHGSGAHAD